MATLEVAKRPSPTLDAVYVLKAHGKKGIGVRLCTAALERFRILGRVPVKCDVTSEAMHRTIKRLPPELQQLLEAHLSYLTNGDEWGFRDLPEPE